MSQEAPSAPPTDPKSWPWLRAQILAKGEAIATSLRSGVSADTAVPNLEWNVGRLGAHIVAIPQMYLKAQHQGLTFPDFDKVNEFSDATAAEVGTTDPVELADLLVPQLQAFLDMLGDDADAPAKFYQHDLTALQAGGVLFSELLAHHLDLIGATGESRSVAKITGEQARAAFAGLFPASQFVVDVEVARKCNGIIHIHLTGSDGGDHWTTTVSGDTAVTTPGKPAKADFHTRADPVALLLVSLGRANQVKALLTGQIIGYGRNPLLGFRSQHLFHEI